MKISQFEDMQRLQMQINECLQHLNELLGLEVKNSEYFIVPKLNLIFLTSADVKLFLNVTNEYKSNKKLLTKLLASTYIFLLSLVLKIGLGRIFLKVITLKSLEFYPLIIGGNNRLRFINSSNSYALVIAKNLKNTLFTKNAIRAFNCNQFSDLEIIPDLFHLSDRVYLEKQIAGIAINRAEMKEDQHDSVKYKIDTLFSIQQNKKRNTKLSSYLRYKNFVLKNYAKDSKSDYIKSLNNVFLNIGNKILKKSESKHVSVCLSHGDLNRGNIFIDQHKVSVIDWEYFMYRYINYDYLIYNFDLRHQTLPNYIKILEKDWPSNCDLTLFLYEELFFRILNYKEDVKESRLYIDTMIQLISKNLIISNEA